MYNLKIKKKHLGFIICCIGLFIIPYILRNKIATSIAAFNIIFYIGLLICYYNGVLKSPLKRKEKVYWQLWYILFFVFSAILLFFVIKNGYDTEYKIKVFFCNILPALIVFAIIPKDEDVKKLSDYWFGFLKLICYIMLLTGLLDKIIGNNLQRFLANFYNTESLYSMLNSGRLISFYGHSLLNANIFLMFLLWTLIRKKKNISAKNYIMNTIVAFLGVALTGSKSALILAFIMVIIFITDRKNLKYIIPLSCLVIIALFSGVLDMTLNRLLMGIESGDLTTSRNTALTKAMENGSISFEWFKGHFLDGDVPYVVIALEYPLLRLAFKYGIAFTLMFFITFFAYPIFKLIRTKEWRILLGLVAYMVYVNGYDGISSIGDTLLLYTMNIMLIISLCRTKTAENIIEKSKNI